MNRFYRNTIIAVFSISLSMPMAIQAKSSEALAISTFARGEAWYVRNGKKKKVGINTFFYQDDKLVTGDNGKLNVQIGANSVIRLDENTILEMKKLQELKKQQDVLLSLSQGQLYIKLTKKLPPGSKYRISTPTTTAAVRGTEFLVAEENEESEAESEEENIESGVYVKEGTVSVTDHKSGYEIAVEAGNQILTKTKEKQQQILDEYVAKKMQILEKMKTIKESTYQKLKDQKDRNLKALEKIRQQQKELHEKMKQFKND